MPGENTNGEATESRHERLFSALANERNGEAASQGQPGPEVNDSEPDATSGETADQETDQDPVDGEGEAPDTDEDAQTSTAESQDEATGADENEDATDSGDATNENVVEVDEDAIPERFEGRDSFPEDELTDEEYEAVFGESRGRDSTFHETPTGSVYKNAEDAREGLNEKDRYISELEERLSETEGQSAEAKQELESYHQLASPEDLKERAIRERMPEELRDLDPDETNDDDTRREIKDARWKAEKEVEEEIQKAEEAQKEQAERANERHEAANEYASETLTPDTFGAENPEDRSRLEDEFESERFDGYTTRQSVAIVHEALGEDAADFFVRGLKEDYRDDVQEEVDDAVRRVVVKPRKTPTETKDKAKKDEKPEPKSRRDRALAALAEEGN